MMPLLMREDTPRHDDELLATRHFERFEMRH